MGVLKLLEINSFAALVGAFRAQGNLTDEKREILKTVADIFGISNERYKAEIRRVISDEELAQIAEEVAGPGTEDSWIPEGRRNVKLLKRKSPKMSVTLQEYLSKLADTEAVLPPTPMLRQPPICPPTLPADFSAILLADQVTPPVESMRSDNSEVQNQWIQDYKEGWKPKRGGRKDSLKREAEEPPAKKQAVEKKAGSQRAGFSLEGATNASGSVSDFSDDTGPPPLVAIDTVRKTRPQQPPIEHTQLKLNPIPKSVPRPVQQQEIPARPEPRIPAPKPPMQSRIFPIPTPPDLPLDQQIRASFKPERGTLTPIRPQVKYVTLPPITVVQPKMTQTTPRATVHRPVPTKAALKATTNIGPPPPKPRLPLATPSAAEIKPSDSTSSSLPTPTKSVMQAPAAKPEKNLATRPGNVQSEMVSSSNPPKPNWNEILSTGEQPELSLDEAVTLLENTPDANNILQYLANTLEQGQASGQLSFDDFGVMK